MLVLHLADQKVSTMGKLHYGWQQADRMFPKYLKEAENHSVIVLTAGMKKMLADTTDIASQVIECNEDEDEEMLR